MIEYARMERLIKSIKSANRTKSKHIASSKLLEEVAKEEKEELKSIMRYQGVEDFVCEHGKAFFDGLGNLQVH